MARVSLFFVGAVVLQVTLGAQTPAAAPSTPPTAPTPQAKPPAPARGFDYDPSGRRDPFVSLVGRGTATQTSQPTRAAGLAGLETAEVALKGTMVTGGGPVAMLQGSDGRTYVVRAGDKLRDGSVKAITTNAVVILQHVNDPLSREKEREVRKTIRQTDEAK